MYDDGCVLVGQLVVFNVPSTARSFRDGTPIYCPMGVCNISRKLKGNTIL